MDTKNKPAPAQSREEEAKPSASGCGYWNGIECMVDADSITAREALRSRQSPQEVVPEVGVYEEVYSLLADMKPRFEDVERVQTELFNRFSIRRKAVAPQPSPQGEDALADERETLEHWDENDIGTLTNALESAIDAYDALRSRQPSATADDELHRRQCDGCCLDGTDDCECWPGVLPGDWPCADIIERDKEADRPSSPQGEDDKDAQIIRDYLWFCAPDLKNKDWEASFDAIGRLCDRLAASAKDKGRAEAAYNHAEVFHTRLVAAQESLADYPGVVTELVQGYGIQVNEHQIDAWLRDALARKAEARAALERKEGE